VKPLVLLSVVITIQAFAITNVGGVISTNTVWGPTGNPPDSIYNIVSQVFISPGITLTIQPGVRVQSSSYGFQIEGCIIANGTANDSIRFTSSQAPPNPGDWGGFFYFGTPTDSSFFSYCVIEYATYGFDGGSLIDIRNSTIGKCIFGTVLITSSVVVDCEISDNTYGGIGIGNIYADSMDCVVGGNLISNNGVGIYYGHRSTLPEMSTPNYFADNDTGIVIVGWSGLEVDGPQEWNPAVGGIDCYLQCGITIAASGRLTIVPGNSFKFPGDGFHVEGQIVAIGTENDSITFTSALPIPNQGDWLGIWFDAYSPDTSVFEYCAIEYGYEIVHDNGTPLRMANSNIRHQISGLRSKGNATVVNCEFSHNVAGVGCACYPDTLDIIIANSDFHDNTFGIHVGPSIPSGGKLPIFTVPSQFSDNDHDIHIETDIVVKNNVNWQPAAGGVDCTLIGLLKIDTTGTFTIGPGNTFRLFLAIEVFGQLIACGTEQSKITFTSALPNPAPGNWGAILFHPGAQTGIMEHCIIEYSEWGISCYNDSMMISNCVVRNSNRGVSFICASGTIENSIISNNEWFGILVTSLPTEEKHNLYHQSIAGNSKKNLSRSDTVLVTNCTISNNEIGIYCYFDGNPHVEFNEIYANTEWGIYNEDNDYWIYAENNWWGDSTGPCDTSDIDTLYNPNGLGDRVSDHVDYDPWIGFVGCVEKPSEAPLLSDLFNVPYPNPFVATTTFSYSFPRDQHVKCAVYNALGQVVRTLCDQQHPAGSHRLFWDGNDNLGRVVPRGVYWCRFEAESSGAIQKVVKLE